MRRKQLYTISLPFLRIIKNLHLPNMLTDGATIQIISLNSLLPQFPKSELWIPNPPPRASPPLTGVQAPILSLPTPFLLAVAFWQRGHQPIGTLPLKIEGRMLAVSGRPRPFCAPLQIDGRRATPLPPTPLRGTSRLFHSLWIQANMPFTTVNTMLVARNTSTSGEV